MPPGITIARLMDITQKYQTGLRMSMDKFLNIVFIEGYVACLITSELYRAVIKTGRDRTAPVYGPSAGKGSFFRGLARTKGACVQPFS